MFKTLLQLLILFSESFVKFGELAGAFDFICQLCLSLFQLLKPCQFLFLRCVLILYISSLCFAFLFFELFLQSRNAAFISFHFLPQLLYLLLIFLWAARSFRMILRLTEHPHATRFFFSFYYFTYYFAVKLQKNGIFDCAYFAFDNALYFLGYLNRDR